MEHFPHDASKLSKTFVVIGQKDQGPPCAPFRLLGYHVFRLHPQGYGLWWGSTPPPVRRPASHQTHIHVTLVSVDGPKGRPTLISCHNSVGHVSADTGSYCWRRWTGAGATIVKPRPILLLLIRTGWPANLSGRVFRTIAVSTTSRTLVLATATFGGYQVICNVLEINSTVGVPEEPRNLLE